MQKITKKVKTALFLLLILSICGCYGHGAYMGLHGKSIQNYPEIHDAATQDSECLECHHPDSPQGPPTPHPKFTGCLKCHNDEI